MRAAALAFSALDHDQNGVLCLDEFEQLLVGTTMATTAADGSLSCARGLRVFSGGTGPGGAE